MKNFEFLKNIKLPSLRKLSVGQMIFWVATLALAVFAFVFVRGLTDCWNLTELPGGPQLATCKNAGTAPGYTPKPGETAIAAPPTPMPEAPALVLPPAWDGASRINILFIGIDARDVGQDGPPRSDTLMLLTIDPISKTAGMLSIPRDMWVNIPGFGYSRINTAYSNGEGSKLPGGGPGLAMKTVSQFIGVPVDYYAQVDFDVFTILVDHIIGRFGCIEVFPNEDMVLDPIGSGTDHMRLTTGGGRNLCQGWKVLAYARNRHTSGGDFDRAARQQEVILALQKKIFDPAAFPVLIKDAPALYDELSSGIHTNMSFEDAIKLAILAKDISPTAIKKGVIDTTMVTFDNVVLGGQDASIMKPISDKIRVLRDEIFTTTGPTSPIAQGDPVTLMRNEEARVRILDGTFTPGLDQRAGSFFQSQGLGVTEIGTATEAYSQTVVIVYGPKLYTLRYLQSALGISASQIRFSPDPTSTVDIEIRVGSDLAGSIP
ncbi:MAG: LCP family protein [Anaerolineales bacterium]|nr:LCP family protein [Anaerolineales bacterium]